MKRFFSAVATTRAAHGWLAPQTLSAAVCSGLLAIYFFGFVHPAAVAEERAYANAAAIPQLAKRVAAAEQRSREMAEAAATARLAVLSSVRGLQSDVTLRRIHRDLSRLAQDRSLRVVGIHHAGAWNDAEPPFVHARTTWGLRGGYFDYLAFKRALTAYKPVIVHVASERLTRIASGELSADVTLSFYRINEIEEP